MDLLSLDALNAKKKSWAFGIEEVIDIRPIDAVSRQAAIDAIIKAYYEFTGILSEPRARMFEQTINVLPPAQPEPHWIPCSERLPEPGEYYLVTRQYFGWNCTEYREIDIAKYDFDGWHKADTVLAWCELPKPYREEGD